MPLVINKESKTGSVIAVWHITEPLGFFVDAVKLSPTESEHFQRFIPELRKKHWLAYRLLLNMLSGQQNIIIYDTNGKPSISGSNIHISVSHSGDYAAVIISKTAAAGIDIEKITPRIEKVFDKFMNEDEINGMDATHRLEYMYVYWSAKEALYKLYGKGNLDFRKDMNIPAFNYSPPGIINATLITETLQTLHTLYYEQLNDYILVYTPL